MFINKTIFGRSTQNITDSTSRVNCVIQRMALSGNESERFSCSPLLCFYDSLSSREEGVS